MKKTTLILITLLGTVGGLLCALGLCMCLLPEWDAFTPGAALAAIGAVALLSIWPISRKAAGKGMPHVTGGLVVTAILGLAGAVTFGVGLVSCLQAVTSFGLGAGIAGLVLLFIAFIAGRLAAGKSAVPFNGKLLLAYLIGIAGALLLGIGMCAVMVWGAAYMLPGIVVGSVGLFICILNVVLRVVKTN